MMNGFTTEKSFRFNGRLMMVGTDEGQFFATPADFFAAHPDGEIRGGYYENGISINTATTPPATRLYHRVGYQPDGEWHRFHPDGPIVQSNVSKAKG